MFVGLSNTPRDYAWGSLSAIAQLLGVPASGRPEAEYWLGTHPGSPSRIDDPKAVAGATSLADITTLPFLLKVLAAAAPLSLQAHPTTDQARQGFERENALGIPVDAPNRNYRDAKHKPELIYALSSEFVALCGFRPVAQTRALLGRLGDDSVVAGLLQRLDDDAALQSVFEWLISRSVGVDDLVARVVALSAGSEEPEFRMVSELSRAYPGDPGIVIALLLNRVVLRAGQVLYLPAGNIHAYLSGVGIELMAASDNVLRGGLTPKHVDVAELLNILDFRPVPVPLLAAEHPVDGVEVFRPDVPDFELAVVRPTQAPVRFALTGEALLLCTEGNVLVTGAVTERWLSRGQSVYVTADEGELGFAGEGLVFVATTNAAGTAAKAGG
jgi:mannose-6-phosphate isomerase